MQTQTPPDQSARLYPLHPDLYPGEFILKDDVCTIGRSTMCNIVVPGQKTVSRLHAKIEREGPRYVLHDTNSANGTFVNERRINDPHLLKDDDEIGFGTPQPMLRFADPDPTDVVEKQLFYDAGSMRFFLKQQFIDLTPAEFRLLHHLYRHIGDVCTRQSCAEAIWDREYDPGPDDEGLDRTVSNIRRKMDRIDSSLNPANIIKTRRGLGYELVLWALPLNPPQP